MEKLKSFKKYYSLVIVIVGLLSLSIYTTYSMFTSSIGTESSVISLNTDLNYTFDINSNQSFTLEKDTIISFNAIIKNDTDTQIYYEIYTTNSNNNILVGEVVEDSTTTTTAPNTSGNINAMMNKTVPMVIKNNSDNEVTVNIGVVTNTTNSITYGTNGYPTGTKVTGVYDIDDMTGENCNTLFSNCEAVYETATINGVPQTVRTMKCPSNGEPFNQKIITLAGTNTSELMTITQPATIQVPKQVTEYRYYGATPNNYVWYNCKDTDNNGKAFGTSDYTYSTTNCEKWRIIGVFETETPVYNGNTITSYKTENRVKIIRDESIGNYSWDSSDSSVNSGSGINAWEQADLMTTLNGIYMTKGSGICYNGEKNTTKSCDFSTTGLSVIAKTFVESAKYYLGGSTTLVATASMLYSAERSDNLKNCTSGDACNDTVTRQTSWTGVVGLMYPSDYGYAAGNSCLSTIMSSYNSTCKNTDWLFKSSQWIWTLSPALEPSNAAYVFNVHLSGGFNSTSASGSFGVRPVVYLSSDVLLKDGLGTSTSPFIIGK